MIFRATFSACLALTVTWGHAQVPGAKPKVVSTAVGKKVFERMWTAIAGATNLPQKLPVTLSSNSPLLSKPAAISAFWQLRNAIKPRISQQLKMVKFDENRLRAGEDKEKLRILVAEGYVMPYGPLATGKPDSILTVDFGDAVAVFLLKVSELCHIPSRKFSPILMRGDQMGR